jgi:hypothetical protein
MVMPTCPTVVRDFAVPACAWWRAKPDVVFW